MSSERPLFSSRGPILKQIISVGAGLALGLGLVWTVQLLRGRRGMASASPDGGVQPAANQAALRMGKNTKNSGTGVVSEPGERIRMRAKASEAVRLRATAGLARLPIIFEPNEGQATSKVRFLAHDGAVTMLLEANGALLALPATATPTPSQSGRVSERSSAVKPPAHRKSSGRGSMLRMELVGSSPSAQVSGEERLPGKTNYFIGNNPRHWRTGVAEFERVRYHDIYPGVDMVYYGNHGQLEYDFVLAPGRDPGKIRFRFDGLAATSPGTMRLDSHGNLIVRMGGGRLEFHRPTIYQLATNGETGDELAAKSRPTAASVKLLSGRFLIERNNQVSFALSGYDKTKPLVIDPTLSYSSYLGGSSNDQADVVALDSAGNIYIDGTTTSANFPVQSAYQSSCSSCASNSPDSFITEMSADGSKLIFSTFLGGSAEDDGNGIALDSSGNIYVTGRTYSSDFPVTANAFQLTCSSCTTQPDVYVTKLAAGGASLVYSTFLGGSAEDDAFGIATDSSGDAYVVGRTASTNFPTKSPIQSSLTGSYSAFVSEFNPQGTALVYSTYLGGAGSDYGFAIAVDSSGAAYVTGQTTSNNFPTTSGAYQTAFGGNQNVFVSKIKPGGSGLAYSTYLGGSGQDSGRAIAVDSAGDAYVDGSTTSSNFPVLNAAQSVLGAGGATNGFIAKLKPDGTALDYSTYLGGSGQDVAGSIAIDKSGRAYITGVTSSTNFPTANPLSSQTKYGGNNDAFVAKLSPGGCGLAFSTYLGGIAQDVANGIAVTNAGNPVVVGETTSNDFPVTSKPYQAKTAGQADVFVSVLTGLAGPVDCFSPQTVKFSSQVATTTSAAQTVTLTNDGEDPLTITDIGTTAEFAETNTCIASGSTSGTVQPGANCTISLTFTPITQGSQLGILTVTDNGPKSPHSLAMSGTGQDFTFTANPPVITVSAGQQAQYTLTVSPLSGFNQSVALTCSGGPPDSTCTVNPKSVTLDGTSAQMATVAVATTARSGEIAPYTGPRLPPQLLQWKFDVGAMALMALLMVLLAGWARRGSLEPARNAFRLAAAIFALLVLTVVFWSSCGGNGTLPTGTPAGSYGITITGTDATLIHSGQLQLKVK
jgi:Beta-propeller repeat/Abnormal spindle-like microcephaly-assoc'd, ASPM-SPD-2-Hydin